jgi:hypothetical protein
MGGRRSRVAVSSRASAAAGAAVDRSALPSVLGQAKKPTLNAVILGVGGRGGGAGARISSRPARIVGVEGKIVAVADIFPGQARRGREAFGVPEPRSASAASTPT